MSFREDHLHDKTWPLRNQPTSRILREASYSLQIHCRIRHETLVAGNALALDGTIETVDSSHVGWDMNSGSLLRDYYRGA